MKWDFSLRGFEVCVLALWLADLSTLLDGEVHFIDWA